MAWRIHVAHSKMLSDLLHIFEVKECIETGFVCERQKEMRHYLMFYYDPSSTHHGIHLCEPNPVPSLWDSGCWMTVLPCPTDCNAAIRSSKLTAMAGGQASRQTSPQHACPGKQGPAQVFMVHTEKHLCEHNSMCGVGRYGKSSRPHYKH